MKKLVTLFAAAALTVTAAHAQFRFGPELGLNMTSLTGKVGGESESSDMKIGARIGGVVDIPVTSGLYVRPGIQFSLMGGKQDFLGTEVTANLSYIQVPVNILYKLGEEGAGRFYFGVVPYFGFAIGGKYKSDAGDADMEFGDDPLEHDYKPMDFGAGLKVGYELPMGLYFDAAFIQGLSNNAPGGDSDNKVSNRNITIGVGYLLGGK